MIAGRLTMRAAVERNQTTGTDSWNNPLPADFQSIGDPLPCFVWSKDTNKVADGGKVVLIEDMRAMFALGADIQANDEIASVTDRKGTEIIPGRLKVEGEVQRKHTHLECALERIA